MRAPVSLASAQDKIRSLVTAPEGVAEALREMGDPDGRELSRLLRGDRGLSATARLGVYSNAFFERLRGALAKDFEDLARALGPDAFHDLVRVYLMLHPPHRPSIRHAGASLATFLAEDEVAAPFRRHLPCAPDLAAFEWAQTEVFDARDAALLTRESLAGLAPELWPSLRLEAIPAFQLLRVEWPVQELADDAALPEARALAPRATHLRVWRFDERVRWREISPHEHAALLRLAAGAPFGAVCERVAEAVGTDAAPPEAARLLATWIEDGCLRAQT
jgi:hypothetical protein